MPLEIQRTLDRVKLTNSEIATLVKEFVAEKTGRSVSAVEFHIGRGELGAATVYLEFKD